MTTTPQKTETQVNVALLLEVQRAITNAPTQFHIGEWSVGEVWPGAADKCSGSVCLAGWAVVLGCRARLSLLTGTEIERLGREVLGLSEDAANRLFLLSRWPVEFRDPYLTDPRTLADYKHNAHLTTRRIEVFIATGC